MIVSGSLLFLLANIPLSADDGVISWRVFTHSYSLQGVRGSLSIDYGYLNSLRKKAGMIELKRNSYLEKAAKNHSLYMVKNNVFGHGESQSGEGFTGYKPADRAVYAGYPSRYVLENISAGDRDGKESIDGLFSAIYHRFGFLNEVIDEVGGGVASSPNYYYRTAWTYDMGNSNIAALCTDSNTYSGSGYYFHDICKDKNKKISSDKYLNALSSIGVKNSALILWPYKNATDIPPVFYEESPDPLPDCSVSGYPVSVKFNRYKTSTSPQMESFKLYKGGKEIKDVRVLTVDSDPNSKFSEYEFALFPIKRLEWGEEYKAVFKYHTGGDSKTLSWKFKTRELPYDYYVVTPQIDELKLLSGKTYALYFPPKDCNDKLGGYSCQRSTLIISSDFIDHNTLKIKLTGDVGGWVKLSFNNGKKLKLIVSNSESPNLHLKDGTILTSSSSVSSSVSSSSSSKSPTITISCPDGYSYNEETGLCVKEQSSSSASNSSSKLSSSSLNTSTSSSSSSSKSSSNSSKSSSTSSSSEASNSSHNTSNHNIKCPSGYTYNPEIGFCISKDEPASSSSSSKINFSSSTSSQIYDPVKNKIKKILKAVKDKPLDINGYFIHYSDGAYDWIYVSKSKRVYKLEGMDEDGYLKWLNLSWVINGVNIDKNSWKIYFDTGILPGMEPELTQIIDAIENKNLDIDGFFTHYGDGAYDWIYVSKSKRVYKLEGMDEEGYLEWLKLSDYIDEVFIDKESGKIILDIKE